MKQIYEFNNYKSYLNALVLKSDITKGEVYSHLAIDLRVSETKLRRMLEGNKHFSREQLFKFCSFFKLGDLETKYLLTLLRLNEASSWQEIDSLCAELEQLKLEIIDLRVEQTTSVIVDPSLMECA